MKRSVTSYSSKRKSFNILSIRSEDEDDIITGKELNHFEILNTLGKGSSGRVFKVKCILSGQERVLKQIWISGKEKSKLAQGMLEAKFMKRIKHKNFVRYYNSFCENSYFNIIMEYAEGGDLQNVLIKSKRESKQIIYEKDILRYLHQIIDSLIYLHSRNIIHRDIKAHNIFLTKDDLIKIGDLGFCCIYSNIRMEGEKIRRVGTPLYLSPEMVKLKPYDYKVDIWALGCLIHNMATLEPPFKGESMLSLGFNIVNKTPKSLNPENYSDIITSLIQQCLNKDQIERPTAVELKKYLQTKFQEDFNKKDSLGVKEPQPKKEISFELRNKKIEEKIDAQVKVISLTTSKEIQNDSKNSNLQGNIYKEEYGRIQKIEKQLPIIENPILNKINLVSSPINLTIKRNKQIESYKILSLNNINSVMQKRNFRLNSGNGFRSNVLEAKNDELQRKKPNTSYGYRDTTKQTNFDAFPAFQNFSNEEKSLSIFTENNLFKKVEITIFKSSTINRPQTSQDTSSFKKRVSLKDLLRYKDGLEPKENNVFN